MIQLERVDARGEYYTFWISKERIGIAEKIGDRWLVHGKRKQVATIKEAAKQMIDAKMSQLENEKARYHKLLQRVLSEAPCN
jgi:hypothetical protein